MQTFSGNAGSRICRGTSGSFRKRILTTLTKTQLRKAIYKQPKSHLPLKYKKSRYLKRIRNGQLGLLVSQKQVQCPICLEVMISPTMQACGHTYCFRCLTANQAHRKCCCICRRQEQAEFNLPSLFAQRLINNYVVAKYNHKDLIKYLCRSSDSAEWIKRRKVTNLKEGAVIDFCDHFNVWRKAIVSNITMEDQKSSAEVKFSVKGQKFVDKVQTTSSRLAPYAFFTKGRYLLDFAPCLPAPEIKELPLSVLQQKNVQEGQDFFRPLIQQNQHQHQEIIEPQQQQVQGSLLDQALNILQYNLDQQYQFG